MNNYGPKTCEHCGKRPSSKKAGRPQNRKELALKLAEIMGWKDFNRNTLLTSREMEDLIKRLESQTTQQPEGIMNVYHLRYEIRIDDSESIEADSFSDAMHKLTERVKKNFGRSAEIKIESSEIEGGEIRGVGAP